jgi:O-antigen ligase
MQKLLRLPEKLFKYVVAAILIFVPLYPKFPFIKIAGTYVAVRFEDFLIAGALVLALVKIIPKIKEFLKDEIIRSILLFLLVGLVSLISGAYVTETLNISIGALHLLRRVEYFAPFILVLALFPYEKGKNLEFYIKVLMLVVVLAFFYGLGQRYLSFPVIITQNMEYSKGVALRWVSGSHINSTFAGHYDLASFMVLVLPIFISLFFVYKDKLAKIFLAFASLSGFWLLINSISRISFFSYLLAVFSALVLMKKFKAAMIVVLISVVLSAFSPSLFARYKRLIDVAIEVKAQVSEVTLKDQSVFEDRSSSIRFNVEWPRAVRALVKNPLLGTGYSSIDLATDNDYLRLLGEVGLLGFGAFMLILFNISKVLTKIWVLTSKLSGVELGFVAGVSGGLIGILTNAVFIDVFEASKFALIFWLLIGLTVSIARNALNDQKN